MCCKERTLELYVLKGDVSLQVAFKKEPEVCQIEKHITYAAAIYIFYNLLLFFSQSAVNNNADRDETSVF